MLNPIEVILERVKLRDIYLDEVNHLKFKIELLRKYKVGNLHELACKEGKQFKSVRIDPETSEVIVIWADGKKSIIEETREYLTESHISNSYIDCEGYLYVEVSGIAVYDAGDAAITNLYQLAVNAGYTGSLDDWLASLVGKSAYELALDNGFVGSLEDWLDSIQPKDSYSVALDIGYQGTREEWVSLILTGDKTFPVGDVNTLLITNSNKELQWQTINEFLQPVYTALDNKIDKTDLGNQLQIQAITVDQGDI